MCGSALASVHEHGQEVDVPRAPPHALVQVRFGVSPVCTMPYRGSTDPYLPLSWPAGLPARWLYTTTAPPAVPFHACALPRRACRVAEYFLRRHQRAAPKYSNVPCAA
ncbi:hypothetical protein U9M48_007031 [Paspalum notatum var. saurae]|uniref:Uncharacterized protein n=1 Tax=Paspalum notatum var. saurae TaxID=547442 RepID=A0AAQ3PVT8_PASNO